MARYLKLEYINIGRDIVNQIREIVTKAVVAKGKIIADGNPKELVPVMEENSLALKQFDGE